MTTAKNMQATMQPTKARSTSISGNVGGAPPPNTLAKIDSKVLFVPASTTKEKKRVNPSAFSLPASD